MASLNRSTLNQLYPSIKRYCWWTRMRKFVEVTRESAPTSGGSVRKAPGFSGRSSHMNLIWQQLKRCHGRTLSRCLEDIAAIAAEVLTQQMSSKKSRYARPSLPVALPPTCLASGGSKQTSRGLLCRRARSSRLWFYCCWLRRAPVQTERSIRFR